MLMLSAIFKLLIIGATATLLFIMADDWFDDGGLH